MKSYDRLIGYKVSWIYLDMRDFPRFTQKPVLFWHLSEAQEAVADISQDPGIICIMIDEVDSKNPGKVLRAIDHRAFPDRCGKG